MALFRTRDRRRRIPLGFLPGVLLNPVPVFCATYYVANRSGSSGNPITHAAHPGDTITVSGSGIAVPTDAGLFHPVDTLSRRT